MRTTLSYLFVCICSAYAMGQTYSYHNFISTSDTVFCVPDSFVVYAGASQCVYLIDTVAHDPFDTSGATPTMYDNSVSNLNIGFDFDYYCNTYNQIWVSSNGWVSFSNPTTAWANNGSPNLTAEQVPTTTASVPKNCIMGPWKDYVPNGSYYIHMSIHGSAPNRQFAITWTEVPMYSCSSLEATFQIVLYETSNRIRNYLTFTPSCSSWQSPNFGAGTQALHNFDGTDATVINGRNGTAWSATNEGWEYRPTQAVWVWQGDTVGYGNELNVTPNGFYPQSCDYLYLYLDSLNGTIAYDSVLISPLCIPPLVTVQDVECTGDSSGVIIAEDTSGQTIGPWVYHWTDSNGNTIRFDTGLTNIDTISGLPIGTYDLVITDTLSGCYAIYGSAVITEPDSTTGLAWMTAVECTGDASGIVFAEDTNDYSGLNTWDGLYSYYWESNGTAISTTTDTTGSINEVGGLPVGIYDVTVDGCLIQTASVEITEPDTVNAYIEMEPVNCFGESSGKVVAEDTHSYAGITTWDGLYSFSWAEGGTSISTTNNTTSSADSIVGLPIGTYSVTVDGCLIQTGSITVTEPPLLVSGIINASTVSCPGTSNCDAVAEGTASGGVPPYSYLWSSGENNQIASQLCSDTNWLYLTDFNGCTDTSFVIIAIPPDIVTSAIDDTMICISNPANLAAATVGGTPPYSYVWREGSLTGPVVSTNVIETVYPSVTTLYLVSTTDANGCPGDTADVLVKVRPPLGAIMHRQRDTICPYDTINLTVEGTGGDSIYTYAWSSGNFTNTTFVSPDEPQWFSVTVSDQCGTPVHIDSIFVQVGGYSPIDVQISVEDDSICIGENVYLVASGNGGWRGPHEYMYTWSEAGMSNAAIQFVSPTATTSYAVTISDLCLSEPGHAEVTVFVGHPWNPTLHISPATACTEADVVIRTEDVRTGYAFHWDLGDGSAFASTSTDTIIHTYNAPGCYDLALDIVNAFGCASSASYPCAIEIFQSPSASFDYHPRHPTSLESIVYFHDRSTAADSIVWFRFDDTLSLDSNFHHTFLDTGAYDITLVAISENGCRDTLTQLILFEAERTLYIPTAFSPDEDGLNDHFKIYGEAIDQASFELLVFDRWGQVVFYSKNPDFNWDGRSIRNGNYVPIGSYPFTLQYLAPDNELRKHRGIISVTSSGIRTGLR